MGAAYIRVSAQIYDTVKHVFGTLSCTHLVHMKYLETLIVEVLKMD